MSDETPSGYSYKGKSIPKSYFGGHYTTRTNPNKKRRSIPKVPFTLEHEAVTKQVAAERLASSQKVYDSFGERPYNSPNLSDEEQQFAYGQIRGDPKYLNGLHSQAQRQRFLPPDVLDRKTMLGFMEDEARYLHSTGEWDDARFDKAMTAIEGARK